MHKRKLLIGLLVAGLFTAGLGAGLVPASADQRTFRVTFVGGTSTVVTLDVPIAPPASQVQIPGVTLPILSIEDITPPPATTTTAPPASTTPAEQPQKNPGAGKGSKGGKSGSEPAATKQTSQKTTGKDKRKPQGEVKPQVADIVKATKK